MKVVTVSPITNQPIGVLSYFTSIDIAYGDVVSIKIKNKDQYGLVIGIDDARSVKINLRKESFSLHKVTAVLGTLGTAWTDAAQDIAKTFLTTAGEVIYHLIPKKDFFTYIHRERKEIQGVHTYTSYEGTHTERIQIYKEKTQGKKVLVITPSKKQANNIKKLWKETRVGTYQILKDIENTDIIIADQDGASWQMPARPFLDMRYVIQILAIHFKKPLISGDVLLSAYTACNTKIHNEKEIRTILIHNEHSKESKWSPIHKDVQKEIQKHIAKNNHILLYTPRTHYASSITCRDCGHTYTCPHCNKPLIFTKAHDEVKMVCTSCKESIDPELHCPHCNSWNLDTFGIGVERIAEVAETLFPAAFIKTLVKTNGVKKNTATLKFLHEAQESTILCANSFALPLLTTKFALIVCVSLDSTLSVSHYGIDHDVAHTVHTLAQHTDNPIVIQTKFPKLPLWKKIQNTKEFHHYDLENRKLLNYPPHTLDIENTMNHKHVYTPRDTSIQNIQKEVENISRKDQKNVFKVRVT